MTVEVKVLPEVHDDFRTLPTDKLRWEAMRYLVRLRTEPKLGRPLRDHPTMEDLRGCRKIYLDESHDVDPRWRIVYRLEPDETNPTIARVIIVWPRDKAAVYHEAARRIARALVSGDADDEPQEGNDPD